MTTFLDSFNEGQKKAEKATKAEWEVHDLLKTLDKMLSEKNIKVKIFTSGDSSDEGKIQDVKMIIPGNATNPLMRIYFDSIGYPVTVRYGTHCYSCHNAVDTHTAFCYFLSDPIIAAQLRDAINEAKDNDN